MWTQNLILNQFKIDPITRMNTSNLNHLTLVALSMEAKKMEYIEL